MILVTVPVSRYRNWMVNNGMEVPMLYVLIHIENKEDSWVQLLMAITQNLLLTESWNNQADSSNNIT